jgi:hypothetical protein
MQDYFKRQGIEAKLTSFITSNSSCFGTDTPRLAAGQFIILQMFRAFFHST